MEDAAFVNRLVMWRGIVVLQQGRRLLFINEGGELLEPSLQLQFEPTSFHVWPDGRLAVFGQRKLLPG